MIGVRLWKESCKRVRNRSGAAWRHLILRRLHRLRKRQARGDSDVRGIINNSRGASFRRHQSTGCANGLAGDPARSSTSFQVFDLNGLRKVISSIPADRHTSRSDSSALSRQRNDQDVRFGERFANAPRVAIMPSMMGTYWRP